MNNENFKVPLTKEEYNFVEVESLKRNISVSKYIENVLSQYGGNYNLLDEDFGYFENRFNDKLDLILLALDDKLLSRQGNFNLDNGKIYKRVHVRMTRNSLNKVTWLSIKTGAKKNYLIRRVIQLKMNENYELTMSERIIMDRINLIEFSLKSIYGEQYINKIRNEYYKKKKGGWDE